MQQARLAAVRPARCRSPAPTKSGAIVVEVASVQLPTRSIGVLLLTIELAIVVAWLHSIPPAVLCAIVLCAKPAPSAVVPEMKRTAGPVPTLPTKNELVMV